MKIEKITKLKNGKYKIKLDTFEFITYDDIIINHGLLYKKELDNTLFNTLSLETSYYDTYNKCVKYCMKKVRSEDEVRKYLDKLEINSEDSEKIINKLKSINLINDRVYVRCYINDKIYLSKDSLNKIRKDLNITSNINKESIIYQYELKVSYIYEQVCNKELNNFDNKNIPVIKGKFD